MSKPLIAIIGGGPAGLMAAETIAAAGPAVILFDRMPSVGRKFLMAGRGGLNLTHSEPIEQFQRRYGAASPWITQLLAVFSPQDLMQWSESLGQPVMIGSSGRVFPQAMKASPLLRAWLARLDRLGVTIVPRAHWTGWSESGALQFADGRIVAADATLLALGGASWPRLGADGGWTASLPAIAIAPLRPSNCGFTVSWSEPFRQRFAGQPLKPVTLSYQGQLQRGEAMISARGFEGGAVYALSARLRDGIEPDGSAELLLNLAPDIDRNTLATRLDRPRGSVSLSNFLRKHGGLSPVAIGLVQEVIRNQPAPSLAQLVTALPLRLTAPFDLSRAISSAGGIALAELDERLMLRKIPGLFVAGEMLDWEAPTGGYLLQACLASGRAAGLGLLDWLGQR
jgi:uncharacterized flavoprotein (TIGR03862 family)